MTFSKTLLVAALLTCTVHLSAAHTRMYKPMAVFPKGLARPVYWIGSIDGKQYITGKYDYALGVQGIANAMAANGTKRTLREFVDNHIVLQPLSSDGNAAYNGTGAPFTPSVECGHTLTTGARQMLPPMVDMPWTHPGPCEIWCDNTRVFFNADCKGNSVGKVAIENAKCKGASLLQGTLVAVHSPRWQVLTNCVPLVGGKETDPKKAFTGEKNADKGGVGKDTDEDSVVTKAPAPSAKLTPAPLPEPSPVKKCRIVS